MFYGRLMRIIITTIIKTTFKKFKTTNAYIYGLLCASEKKQYLFSHFAIGHITLFIPLQFHFSVTFFLLDTVFLKLKINKIPLRVPRYLLRVQISQG